MTSDQQTDRDFEDDSRKQSPRLYRNQIVDLVSTEDLEAHNRRILSKSGPPDEGLVLDRKERAFRSMAPRLEHRQSWALAPLKKGEGRRHSRSEHERRVEHHRWHSRQANPEARRELREKWKLLSSVAMVGFWLVPAQDRLQHLRGVRSQLLYLAPKEDVDKFLAMWLGVEQKKIRYILGGQSKLPGSRPKPKRSLAEELAARSLSPELVRKAFSNTRGRPTRAELGYRQLVGDVCLAFREHGSTERQLVEHLTAYGRQGSKKWQGVSKGALSRVLTGSRQPGGN